MPNDFPRCPSCSKPVWAGDVVCEQGGPHALCSDPTMQHHKRLAGPADTPTGWVIGYVDDAGKEHWL